MTKPQISNLIGLFGLRSDGTPDPIRIFRYTPGYINKWYMAEYRKTIPDAADNMVELEMALDQAADLFKEADTEGRGTSTASLCVSRFLSAPAGALSSRRLGRDLRPCSQSQ